MPSNGSNENAVQNSIEETGGIPEIEEEMEISGMTQAAVDKTLSIPDMAADAKATGDAIHAVSENLADLATDVGAIENWTGADIPLNGEPDAPTINEAMQNLVGEAYPVGSIYMTIEDGAPPFGGTWIEVLITATISQLKTGKRGYENLPEGETGGLVHFWLRTE